MDVPQNLTAKVESIGSGLQAVVEATDVSLTDATTETSVPLNLTTAGWTTIHVMEHQNMLTSNTDATVKIIKYWRQTLYAFQCANECFISISPHFVSIINKQTNTKHSFYLSLTLVFSNIEVDIWQIENRILFLTKHYCNFLSRDSYNSLLTRFHQHICLICKLF